MFSPDDVLITGTKDDPDGSLRVYISRGDTGLHTHVPAEHREDFLRAMGGLHNVTRVPDEALCLCPEPETA